MKIFLFYVLMSVGLSFVVMYEAFDRPEAFVPMGSKKVVAIKVVNGNKTDYELVMPNNPKFKRLLKDARCVIVAPDYKPDKK